MQVSTQRRAETLLDEDDSRNKLHRPRARVNAQLAMGGSSRGEGTLRRAHPPLLSRMSPPRIKSRSKNTSKTINDFRQKIR
ncbi:hypothetical protein A2U01_0015981 [Trifolium medium]|uniref:Uncharacterized protein n=1 Tax=Trifolium medium TaxID=97028 RepID=A0A392N7M6_9FABA|nr:hypothetical protein [Trifolium medium]